MSNTSPISNLALVGRLSLLRSQFAQVIIPDAVLHELMRIPDFRVKSLIEIAREENWLHIRSLQNSRFAATLSNDLDKGEAEAIALAVEIEADITLMDEKEGRRLARQAGLVVTGVLGSC